MENIITLVGKVVLVLKLDSSHEHGSRVFLDLGTKLTGQLHAPAALLHATSGRGWVGPRAGLQAVAKSLLPFPRIKPRPSSLCLSP
jgi:hypothetical protein